MSGIDQNALAEEMDAFANRIDPALERWRLSSAFLWAGIAIVAFKLAGLH